MNCPTCNSPIFPNPELESEWQLVRCKCGALVEIGHGETVTRESTTKEDYKDEAIEFAYWNNIYWRRYDPVTREQDFEFWRQVEKENRLPEPPTNSAKEIDHDLKDIHNEMQYIRERLDRKEPVAIVKGQDRL